MTDVHCHLSANDPRVREFLIGRDFFGIHPWDVGTVPDLARLREQLLAHPKAGVGEIGLDRLKNKQISLAMRSMFVAQLKLAQELHRPVVLHGAKCWGEVVKTLGTVPETCDQNQRINYLFHGFSRSVGLIPEIARMGGFISVGPAVLNLHAVNYREMVKVLPDSVLVVETDRTEESAAECPSIADVLNEVARLRGDSFETLEQLTDANARRFFGDF